MDYQPLLLRLLFLAVVVVGVSGHTKDEWRSRTIYQVLTDRFAGPDSNSCDLSNYCGGSFKGLIDHLDYIVGMGFDAIWISPVVENTPGGYHGYWAQNMSAINQQFGSSNELKNLVAAAHKKDVWVMVDVVANHMGGTIDDIGSFSPFNQQDHYHDCNGCNENCEITDFDTLYSPNMEHCRLSGLPDLDQDNQWVAEQLNDWVSWLVKEYSFDGIRIDTIPEVKPSFWKSFNKAAGCFAVGEVLNGDIEYVSAYQGPLDAVLSYPMFFTLRDTFAGSGSFVEIQSLSDQMPSKFEDTGVLGTFVDNHDNPRFLNAWNDQVRYVNALAHVLFSSGVPIIYYGTEQGFAGGDDPENREILWPTKFNSDASKNKLISFLKSAIQVRKQLKIWNLDYPVWYFADNQFGVFSRGPEVLVVSTNVGDAAGSVARTVTLSPALFSPGSTFCDALDSSYCTTTASSDGSGVSLDVTLEGGLPRVLVKIEN